jgi:hypothetical protein
MADPVGDDAPAPTTARWTVDRDGRWTVDRDGDADTLWWTFGASEALEPWEALDASDPLNDQFTPAYDALVALVRRAGAAPDLTALPTAEQVQGHIRGPNITLYEVRVVLAAREAAVAALVREDTP